jgi:hypothetical protein
MLSQAAGNHGRPATPRDGAAIEINGLAKSALRWVSALAARGEFPYRGVPVPTTFAPPQGTPIACTHTHTHAHTHTHTHSYA